MVVVVSSSCASAAPEYIRIAKQMVLNFIPCTKTLQVSETLLGWPYNRIRMILDKLFRTNPEIVIFAGVNRKRK